MGIVKRLPLLFPHQKASAPKNVPTNFSTLC